MKEIDLLQLLANTTIKIENINLKSDRETMSEIMKRKWREGVYEQSVENRRNKSPSEEARKRMSEAARKRPPRTEAAKENMRKSAIQRNEKLHAIMSEYNCTYKEAMVILYPKSTDI